MILSKLQALRLVLRRPLRLLPLPPGRDGDVLATESKAQCATVAVRDASSAPDIIPANFALVVRLLDELLAGDIHAQYHCASKRWLATTGLDTTAFVHFALESSPDVGQVRRLDLFVCTLCGQASVDLDRRQASLLLRVDEVQLSGGEMRRHAAREPPTEQRQTNST